MGKASTGNFYGTVMFVDIRNFLGISEVLEPEDVRKFIHKAIDPLAACIKDQKGYICQIQGDAILAVFGLENGSDDHAIEAMSCALNIQKTLDELNPVRIGDLYIPVAASMGVCTGDMYACNINVEGHKEFTVLGKTVNLASRYQKLNKYYGTNILIDETVFAYIKKHIATRKLDKVDIEGCSRSVDLYEVLSYREKPDEETARKKRQYEKGLVNYLRDEWDRALTSLQRVSEDNVYYKMLKRCKELRSASNMPDEGSDTKS